MMTSIVVSTGTFVNNDDTSKDASRPRLSFTLRMSINSSDDFKEYVLGTYEDISVFRAFATSYAGVGICDIMGLMGAPSL